jgi:hypothetical protein
MAGSTGVEHSTYKFDIVGSNMATDARRTKMTGKKNVRFSTKAVGFKTLFLLEKRGELNQGELNKFERGNRTT